jgi:hypothetical protein
MIWLWTVLYTVGLVLMLLTLYRYGPADILNRDPEVFWFCAVIWPLIVIMWMLLWLASLAHQKLIRIRK